MNAMPRERPMIEDHRSIKLEADVEHLCADMSEAKQDIRELQVSVSGLRTEFHEFRIEVTKDFGAIRTMMATRFGEADSRLESFRTEVATKFGAADSRLESFRTEVATKFGETDVRMTTRFGEAAVRLESFRTDVATQFGAVNVQLEALKTLIERNHRQMMVWGSGFLVSMVAMFGTIGHALKWF
jgi:phage-related tail protein